MVLFHYRDKTLRAIQSGAQTTKAIYARDNERGMITILAINQRLRRVWLAGLVKKERGKRNSYVYSLTAKGKRILKRRKNYGRRKR